MVLRGWHRSFVLFVGGTVRSCYRSTLGSLSFQLRSVYAEDLLASLPLTCWPRYRSLAGLATAHLLASLPLTCWPRYRSLAGLATARCQPFACLLASFLTLLYFTLLNLGTTETDAVETIARTVVEATSRPRVPRVVVPATATQHPVGA